MIDSCLQMEITKEVEEMGKKLGFNQLGKISSFSVLRKYDKESLLSGIKSLNYDLIFNLEDNAKFWGDGLARIAGEKKVGVLFTLKKLLDAKPTERSKLLERMKRITKICLRKSVPIVLSSGAEEITQMRGKSELLALASLLGMNGKQAKETLTLNPNNYLKKEKLVYE